MTRVFVLGFNFVLLTGLIWSCPMLAQTTVVPNASFEDGGEGPEGWTLSGGQGTWIEGGPDGARAVSVTGTGASGDNNYWRSSGVVFEPDSVYRLRFRAVRLDGSGGSPTTGPIFCNRDLYEITDEWTEYTSVFATPTDLFPFESWVRFGQWQVSGTVAYDDIELARAQPAYRVRGRLVLGEGERVMGREYTFDAPFKGQSANHARPLESFQATFNTHRWVFGANSEVVYHHSVGSSKQVSAALDVTIGHYTGGELLVEGRIEGQTWRTLGSLNRLGTLSVDLPSDFLPADDVWVRLSSRAGRKLGDNSDPGSFQIYAYSYRATLASDPGDMNGGTRFVATTSADARLEVTVRSFGDVLPGGDNVVVARVNNTSGEKLPVRPALRLTSPMGETSEYAFDTTLHPGEQEIRLAYEIPSSGTLHAVLSLGPTISYAAETTFVVPGLYEISYGSLLPASSDKVALWWASSGWKVARDRPSPTNRSAALRIQTARNEVEAAQLVLCPARGLTGFTAQAGPLTGPDGAVIPADRIEVLRVGYVPVSIPTDRVGVAAPWPDPLPPFQGPANLEAGKQQPLWVRVKAPRDTRPGVYKGAIQLSAKGYTAEAPLEVEVFGFELPDRMTCVTAFGFSPANVFRYHNLSDEMHKRAVLDKYLATLSAHHISPYNPAPLDPFTINWTALTPEFDWTAWDAAMTRAIDEYHFNSFQLPIQGLGGGTFHSRQEPNLLGHTEDQPEYKTAFDAQCKAIEAHLSEKGWLDEAFLYWFDEPDPKDYEFVMNGFRKVEEAAPGIGRMLTEQVEPGLIGGPNIWCPLTPAFDEDLAQERRAQGEKFWWYVCTGPKEPYATLFIDHPATEMRVWLWQTWKRRISGLLIWQTNYWTSDAAYPEHPQNPYEDPMGWTSGYSTPAGTRRPWGNGDGRFIYPPEAAASGQPEAPVLDAPVDSIRFEMLRDGIEDHEYLVILDRLLQERGAALSDEDRREYGRLLQVPDSISEKLTVFTTDPAPIEARREAIARAIEAIGPG